MKKSFLLFGYILSFCFVFGQQTSVIDWKKDLNFLKTELPAKHINLFFKTKKHIYEKELKDLELQVPGLTDFEIMMRIQKIVAGLGDSHTSVKFPVNVIENRIFPVYTYWFDDGLFITATSQEYFDILGKKVISVNNFPVNVIIDSIKTIMVVDNAAVVKSKIQPFLSRQILNYFKFTSSDEISVEVENTDGSRSTKKIQLQPTNTLKPLTPLTVTLSRQEPRKFFREIYIEKDSIYYVQYNKCDGREVQQMQGNDKAENFPSFNEFKTTVLNTLQEKPVKKFIFDMRFNRGGSSPQGTEFIKELATYNAINQKGKLFVIIGRETYSSAILNTLDFKNFTNAILVGEETGGKPSHYGEVKQFVLPSSKITINYSTKYFNRGDPSISTITPDIKVYEKFTDYLNGVDPCYEVIKNYQEP